MRGSVQGIIAVNLAALFLGGTALFAKLIVLPVNEIILGRSMVALIVIVVFSFFWKNKIIVSSRKDLILLFSLGIFMTLHWVSFFYSIQISTVAIGVISLYVYPILTVLMEPLFFKEKIKLLDCLLAALVFFGIILIIPEFTLSNNLSRGVFAGIFSALTFSLRNIIQRKYISHYPGTTIILYQLIVIIILLLPFARFKNPLPDHNNLVLLVVLGIFFTALPHSLFAFGLNNLKAKTVSIIASLQPAYATLFAFLVLGEIPDGKVILGGMIIVSCAVFESLSQSNR